MIEKITSRQNKHLKKCVKLLNSAKFRKQEKLFVIEGARLCKDAYLNNAEIHEMFFTNKAEIKYKDIVCNLKKYCKDSYIVDNNLIKDVTDTNSTQGIVCICKMLDNNIVSNIDENACLGLENIQDPANLGAILRTAAALDFKNIIITNNSCDIYSPKVLRASMGAIFKVNIINVDNMSDTIKMLNKNGFYTCAAVVNKAAKSIREIKFNNKCFVAIGNEGNGLKPDTIKSCKSAITIPMNEHTESLNASMAAGIIIWEMMR